MLKSEHRTNFLQKLNDEEVTLDDRLQIAYGALISQEFRLTGKEQIIIDWFSETLHRSCFHIKGILKTLVKYLKSDYLLAFSDTIDASKLIKTIAGLDCDLRKKYFRQLTKCLLLLMKNVGFQRYCRFEIQPMCQAVILICDLLNTTSTVKGILEDSFVADGNTSINSVLEELCHCIYNIYKVTQQRSELQQQFVKSVLPVFLQFSSHLKESGKFRILLEELVIGDDVELFCEAFKTETKKKIPLHLITLVALLTNKGQSCDLPTLFSLLCDEYINLCSRNVATKSSQLSLFYILSSVIGLQFQLPYATVTAVYGDVSVQLLVLKELASVLQKHNIPASTESVEGILSDFLIYIQKRLLSGEYRLSSELLYTAVNIFKVYPESVRPIFSLIMLHVVFVTKQDKVLKSYDYFMMNTVKIFSDLNQLHKFLTLFFQGAVMISKDQDFSSLSNEMILSRGFYLVLSEKLAILTGNQLKIIIGHLTKIFSKDFITPLENTCLQDGNFCLLLKLIVNVLCHIFENAAVIMPTRWNILSENVLKFTVDVQRFGISVLRAYQVKLYNKYEFLLEFLQLVKVMADLELVVNEYILSMSAERILPVVKSKDKSDAVHNLSKSHGLLIPQEWIYIWEMVREAQDRQLTHAWQNLLLQKYIRLNHHETLTYLTVEAQSDWLWTTVGQMSACVPLNYLELYTDKLLSAIALTVDAEVMGESTVSLKFSEKLSALNNINVLSNRAFRVAMTFQLLNQLARSENSSLSGKLAKLFYVYPLIKFETDFSNEEFDKVNTISNALAEVINQHLWEEQPPLLLDFNTKQFYSRMFDVLTLMHSHCLKTETKRIVCLMMIGLTYDLRGENELLPAILDFILGCLDDTSPVITDYLDSQGVFRWLAIVVPSDYPHRQQLALAAASKVIYTLGKSVKDMSLILCENVELLCAALQSFISVHGSKRLKNRDDYNDEIKLLISLASSIVVTKPKPNKIKLFTAALKAEFLFFKENPPSLLTPLPNYLEILFKRFAESNVVEPDAMELIDLILHHKTDIDSDVVRMVYKALTEELCKTELCPILCYPSSVKSFLEILSSEDFELVLLKVYSHQQKSLSSKKERFTISNVCEMWNLVVNAQVGKDRARVREKMLVQVLTECQSLLEEDISRYHSVVVQLLLSISASKSVILAPKLLDLLLIILGEVPTDSEAHLLPDSLSTLSALINYRPELIFDRIPAFLQRLRKFIKSLVLQSPTESDVRLNFNTVTSNSVNQVTRIIKTMTDHHSKHFARISPYLIADILHLLVTYSVETSVKNELQNCVCNLLSICDHHGTQLLQNLLPVASVELFKITSTTYNKNYKYTGKV